MTLLIIGGSLWVGCATIFCLALSAAAHRAIPENVQAEASNIIPFESFTRLNFEDDQVFVEDHEERRAA